MATPATSLSDEMGFLAQRKLSTILDSDSSQKRNWIGLAGQMKFSYSMVVRLREDRTTRSPTVALLEAWQERDGEAATLELLAGMLDHIGCKEAVDIVKDVLDKKMSAKQGKEAGTAGVPKDFTDTNSNSHHTSKVSTSKVSSTTRNGSEGAIGVVRSKKRFDVFLSYAEEDEEFAEEMRTRLAQESLRVFIPSQGMMAGKVFHQEIANTVKRDCWRTVVILSPSYLASPWCSYEANLSIIKSPDVALNVLVPVLYQSCDIPPFMSHLCCLNYTRYQGNKDKCERSFWKRLIKTLSLNPNAPFS